jgi:GTPase SAR1 family protein
MAGSGKTTLMQRINSHVHTEKIPSYIVNLDPGASELPYGANIDIRDTVKYKEVMKQYGLGPNGGVLTSLNLFATRFDQVMELVEKRASTLENVFVDTPGQIEVFTWSASGTIITEALAMSFPTVLLYVVDTPSSTNPATFMSNMLYACSMLYKTKLPIVVVFNKTDIVSHEFAIEWMEDVDKLDEALNSENNYMSSFTRSLGYVLNEFYQNLRTVGVSAMSGAGIFDLFDKVKEAAKEYEEGYLPDLIKRMKEKEQKLAENKQLEMEKLQRDLKETGGRNVVVNPAHIRKNSMEVDDDEEEEDEEGEYNSIHEYLKKASINE